MRRHCGRRSGSCRASRSEGDWWLVFAVALVFGVLNAVIRPILFVLTLPFLLLTLGLFTFVLNAIMLWLTSATSVSLVCGSMSTGSARPSSVR